MIAHCICCQTVYPKLVFIDNDTLCLITKQQLKQIDTSLISLQFNHVLVDSLQHDLSFCDYEIRTQNELIHEYKSKSSILSKQLYNDEKINELSTQMISNLNKKTSIIKIERNTLFVIVVICVVDAIVHKSLTLF